MTKRNHYYTTEANRHPNMRIILNSVLLLIGSCLLSACSDDGTQAVDEQRQEAITKLEQQDISFTEADFIQRVRLNDLYVVGQFLQAGMSPDTNTGDNSALSYAIHGGNDLMVRLLVNHGANPNQVLTNKKGAFTPLGVAVLILDADIVEHLLDHGGDVNINYDGKYLVAGALAGARLLLDFSKGGKDKDFRRIASMIEAKLDPMLFQPGQMKD